MRDFEFYYTHDGSVGLYSYDVNDVYHSKFGALSEAWTKFVLPSGIDKLVNNKKNINILDVCYGIGYNTKALMSFVINKNSEILKNKKIKKLTNRNKNIVSKYTNNLKINTVELLPYIETNNKVNFSSFNIDCLEMNKTLVKISPLLKTVNYNKKFFRKIFPHTYFYLKKRLKKNCFIYNLLFLPKLRNNKNISQLLNLRYREDDKQLINVSSDYEINKYVNKIILKKIKENFGDFIVDEYSENLYTKQQNYKYFDRYMIGLAKNNGLFGYKTQSKSKLYALLHNIYYRYLSSRYIKMNFDIANSLFNLNFYIDDARKTVVNLIDDYYDLIFLDAFTFTNSPELWTVEFIEQLYKKLSQNGKILTYSNSASVRMAFLNNNLYVGKIKDEITGNFVGTIASKDKSAIKYPLNNYELGLCNTKAGIPYHDENLSLPKEIILKRRKYEFNTSDLITASQYKKAMQLKNKEFNNEQE
ncbi:MAG: MnmC family methyltransferase [bacterium]|nr:MnmC family methyltransferase [bacterium]